MGRINDIILGWYSKCFKEDIVERIIKKDKPVWSLTSLFTKINQWRRSIAEILTSENKAG